MKNKEVSKEGLVTCFDKDDAIKCVHCSLRGDTRKYCWCNFWSTVVNSNDFCSYGENEQKK